MAQRRRAQHGLQVLDAPHVPGRQDHEPVLEPQARGGEGSPTPKTVAVTTSGDDGLAKTQEQEIAEARMKGYEGDSCGECGNFTLLRNGTCMKCDTCGSTSGCS